MDIVQISHLRSFANAVASALQLSTDQSSIHAAQLHDMLVAVDRSVAASSFMTADNSRDSVTPATARVQIPVGPTLQVGEISTLQKAPVPAITTLFAVTSASLEVKGKQLLLASEPAARFFVQIPWGGQSIEIRLDTTTPKNQVVPDALSKTTAIGYFALLPWSSAKIGTLSVGTADANLVRVQALQNRIGQTAIPDFITHALPTAAVSTVAHASGFFATVPWAGRRKNNE